MNRNDNKRYEKKKRTLSYKEFKVKETVPLLEFLFSKYPNLSRNAVKHLLSKRHVSVDGAVVTQFDLLLSKEDVVVVFDQPIRKEAVRKSSLSIIYEDDEFIVIDKPAYLLSVASDNEKRKTAFRLVNDYLQQKDKRLRAFVTHRLDEDTSGVLLFSKNEKIRNIMQKNWQDIIIKRGYYAVVEGTLNKKEDTLVNYLKENNLNLMYVTNDKKNGKKCVTRYKVIRENDKYSLLELEIDSGRKNQIRVQLGHIGHYVLGDDKYGEPSNPLTRLALHAYALAFIHPVTKKKYSFRSKMPKEFLNLF